MLFATGVQMDQVSFLKWIFANVTNNAHACYSQNLSSTLSRWNVDIFDPELQNSLRLFVLSATKKEESVHNCLNLL